MLPTPQTATQMLRTTEPTARIGAVSYLNSKPLVEGLTDFAPEIALRLDVPSRLAEDLHNGSLDVALIPSVELLRHPGDVVVGTACVAARGPVLSVKLYSRVPPGEIRRLALDEGSRTSAALARLMLRERYGVEPETEPLPLGHGTRDSDADAILLIGDRAMHPTGETFHETWDLGEEWFRWTGLPFVFAVWVARAEVEVGAIEPALDRARDLGVERLERIARREAPQLGIPERLALDYLTDNLHFHLGSAERNGLKLFGRLAARSGLVPEGADRVFSNRTAAR